MKGIRAIVTYNCNIMCSCCSFKCSPLKRGIMEVKNFVKRVEEAYNEGYRDYITIEGGEPFLYSGTIFKYLKGIHKLKIDKYIVTNGFWGNIDPYIDILQELKEKGVKGIIIEYDYFHSIYIEKSRIAEAIRKCILSGHDVRLRAFFNSLDMKSGEDEITYRYIKELVKEFKGVDVIFEQTANEGEYVMPSRRRKERTILFRE